MRHLISVFILFVITLAPVKSSEIKYDTCDKSITLSGTIEIEDSDKFMDKFIEINEKEIIEKVYLNSDGGSAVAGYKIGTFLNNNMRLTKGYEDLEVIVKSGARCSSSCAFIWMSVPKQYITQGARIAFHAPYFDLTESDYKDKTPEEVYYFIKKMNQDLGYFYGRWSGLVKIDWALSEHILEHEGSNVLIVDMDFLQKYDKNRNISILDENEVCEG